MYLERGDTVIYSARIPARNTSTGCSAAPRAGNRIVEADDSAVRGGHRREATCATSTSGCSRTVVPVHGTPMHLEARRGSPSRWGSLLTASGMSIWSRECTIVGQAPVGRRKRVERSG